MRLALDPPVDPAAYPFAHPVRVRFAETDAMGIVHHGSYLPYLEEARVAYLRALGHPYASIRDDGLDFAVLEAYVRYLQPLRFDDVVDVHVVVGAASRATFQIGYLLTTSAGGALVVNATAVTVHGCVDRAGRPGRLPAWLRSVLPAREAAP